MKTSNIYLTFGGNCKEAFDFYKSVFGGEFTFIGYFKDMPPSEDFKLDEADMNKIMHVSLPLGNSTLMGSDQGGQGAPPLHVGNNFSISVTADDKAEADKLFGDLSQGGQITMPMNETFWGDYFGMLTDKFGINWMLSAGDQSPE